MVTRKATVLMALAFVSVLVLTAVPAPVAAKPTMIHFTAHLSGSSEVPPNDGDGKGVGQFKFDLTTKMLSFKIKFKGLTGPEGAAHFHLPAPPGVNAPPVITIAGAGPPPAAATSLGSPYIGEVGPLTPAQESALLTGLVYVNIHTAAFPGGEIRGQVISRRLGHTP